MRVHGSKPTSLITPTPLDASFYQNRFSFLFHFHLVVGLTHHGDIGVWLIGDVNSRYNGRLQHNADIVESEEAVVAADDGRCSEIGISMLKIGGHAVDAAVATALCLGVVNPMASGIGGGGFMVVRSSSTSEVLAIDMRETAPLAASQVHNSFFLVCTYVRNL